MTEASSVQSHGVMMLSLVEKLEDLKAGLNNDTYIDEGFNLQGERQGCQTLEEKKGKGTAVTATASTGGAPPLPQRERANEKVGGSQQSGQMMCAFIAMERGIGRGSVHNFSPHQVLQRSRKLSKDEMILRLGDGKAVAAEAVGSLSLVVNNHVRIELKDCYYVPSMSNLIMTAQHKRKVDDHENAEIWHARLGHISKDRIRSAIAKGLLDLVHIDVCGPLSIPARGGFSYFITFTDDHSRYGYVYLMRYKSETFGRFKEYRLEVENQTNRKIKALRSD
ncbi:UNVERIFIED_CONTAM: hypothetical protein Sradi_0173600 [Sesamum radiatum]|uniref:GAG-pre-integrase domain-containing protein n=1 Tax=Sesamum radiatum TaxID=300843 RepID=A0AAW2W2X0_SESRA